MNRNFRFWIWYRGSWVKLTLKPGQKLSYSFGSPDEEGYSWEAASYYHEEDGVREEWADGGRDCDGEIAHYGERWCPASRLSVVPAHDHGNPPGSPNRHYFQSELIHRPDWERIKTTRVYDQYAQLANY